MRRIVESLYKETTCKDNGKKEVVKDEEIGLDEWELRKVLSRQLYGLTEYAYCLSIAFTSIDMLGEVCYSGSGYKLCCERKGHPQSSCWY